MNYQGRGVLIYLFGLKNLNLHLTDIARLIAEESENYLILNSISSSL